MPTKQILLPQVRKKNLFIQFVSLLLPPWTYSTNGNIFTISTFPILFAIMTLQEKKWNTLFCSSNNQGKSPYLHLFLIYTLSTYIVKKIKILWTRVVKKGRLVLIVSSHEHTITVHIETHDASLICYNTISIN